MALPNDAPVFGNDIHVQRSSAGAILLSARLAEILVEARGSYVWPIGAGAADSQRRILGLETETCRRIIDLDSDKAHWIIEQVSSWGGNKPRAQQDLESATRNQKDEFTTAIRGLLRPGSAKGALDALSQQPGLRLVMATKIYRFCAPQVAAALDRHCSYFFNSLCVKEADGRLRTCTQFRREWATGKHQTSRLAVYSTNGHKTNLDEYLNTYLPALTAIAEYLNAQGVGYLCAVSCGRKQWRPADVEMAAYHWWSRNGRR
jgi:hypothetical protein